MSSTITVPGVSGSISLTFSTAPNVDLAQQIADALRAASDAGTLVVVPYSGGTIPGVGAGTMVELVLSPTVTGTISIPTVPAGVQEILIATNNNPVTVNGQPGLTVFGGNNNLSINDPNVIDYANGIGSTDAVTLTGADSPYQVILRPSGNETVTAINGASGTITGALVSNLINLTGTDGANVINSRATVGDTVYAGAGATTINNQIGSQHHLDVGGSGPLTVMDQGTGDTIAAGTGDTNITLAGSGAMVFGGFSLIPSLVGSLFVDAQGNNETIGSAVGAETIVSSGDNNVMGLGSSSNLVSVSGSSNLIYGPSGPSGSGTATIDAGGSSGLTVGGGTGSETINAGSGTNLLVYGSTGNFVFAGGFGSSTVVGEGPTNTVSSGSGPLVFAAGAGGSSSSTVFGTGAAGVTLFGAADASIYYNSSLEGGLFVAGTGNETLNAAGSSKSDLFWGGHDSTGGGLMVAGSGNDTFVAGSGSETLQSGTGNDLFAFAQGYLSIGGGGGHDYLTNFLSGNDSVALYNYGANAAQDALNNATVSGGNVTIALSDNTQITFVGVDNTAALEGKIFST
jgi:hypothetical protein